MPQKFLVPIIISALLFSSPTSQAQPNPDSEPSLPSELLHLLSNDLSVSSQAADQLKNKSPQQVQQWRTALLQLLQSETRDSQILAIKVLGHLQDPFFLEPLLQTLKSKHAIVRQSTAHTLGQMGDKSANQALMLSLQDPNTEVRRESARALGLILRNRTEISKGSSSIQALTNALTKVLGDPDKQVRQYAIETLGLAEDRSEEHKDRLTRAFIQALRDEHEDVRDQAAGSLPFEIVDSLKQRLLQDLQDPDPEIRRLTARAVYPMTLMTSETGDQAIVQALIQIFQKDPQRKVRIQAATTLENMFDESILKLLKKAAKEDPDPEMRRFLDNLLVD